MYDVSHGPSARPRPAIAARAGRSGAVAAAAVLALGVVGMPPAAAAEPDAPFTTVAAGLDNPRGLSVADNGDLFVAEAGHGGDGACIASAEDPSVETCFGTTGAIARIRDGEVTRVVTGLPSLAPQVATQGGQVPPGAQAAGPSDVVLTGSDAMALTIGLGSDPAHRDSALADQSPVAPLLGTLVTSMIPGTADEVEVLADLAAFEGSDDPVVGPNGPDSNPGAVLAHGDGFAVVDAGGNDLLQVDAAGAVSVLATFPAGDPCPPPPIAPEAVPTSVVLGPDGALYVGELTGFPFCEGGASVYRVDDGDVSVYAAGLTNVTGLAFGDDGTLYAVEIAEHGLQQGPMGAVVAIPAGGGSSMADYDVVASGLMAPYGIAVHGEVAYVTVGSILPVTAGGGSVVEVPLAATAELTAGSSSAGPSSTTWSPLPGDTGDASRAAGVGAGPWLLLAGLVLFGGGAAVVTGRRRGARVHT